MLNLEKRIAIAAQIAALPEGAKEAIAFESLYADQVTMDQLATVRAAIRLKNFEEIAADVLSIPKEELDGLNLRQIFDRLYGDQVSREDFRNVWMEERGMQKPAAEARSPKAKSPKADPAPKAEPAPKA